MAWRSRDFWRCLVGSRQRKTETSGCQTRIPHRETCLWLKKEGQWPKQKGARTSSGTVWALRFAAAESSARFLISRHAPVARQASSTAQHRPARPESHPPHCFPYNHQPPHTMTGRGGGGGRRVLLPPINFLFRLLQQRTTVQIWLYEQLSIRIIGTIRVSGLAIMGGCSY